MNKNDYKINITQVKHHFTKLKKFKMAATKNITTGDLVTINIKVNGRAIPDESRVYSIDVTFSINRIATARVVILDGDASKETFKESSSSTFVPGAKLEIKSGYDSKNTLLFKGIIVSQNIQINDSIGSALEVICKDEAVLVTVGRKSLTFSEKTDTEIISSILGNYSITKSVKSTPIKNPQMVQYYTTDWDFMLSRAEANGLMVTVINGKVSVINPLEDTSSVLSLTYGDSIVQFNGDLNALDQIAKAVASSWDYKTQTIVSGESTINYPGAGNISSKKLSDVVGLPEYQLQTSVALNQDELSNWSKAQMIKSELSKFCGEVTCQGNNMVFPGNFITLEGLGDRFNGDHFVSEVTHTFTEGNWITEIGFGLSAEWLTENTDVMAPPAAGLLPGVHGLFTATVKKMFQDPENQFRILVDIPLFDSNGEGLWARLGNFYASSNAGAFFFPEVGDEVIVGFLNEDPRFPIILGSLYSDTKNKPFEGLNPHENNTIKAIVTKSGMQLSFDDEKKELVITTPEKNTVTLSDTTKQITIEDQNSNSVVLSENGIQLISKKGISIEATEKLILKGTQGITIESSGGDVNINGLNIKESAQMEYSAKGDAKASIQASGELTIKGAMVMIN